MEPPAASTPGTLPQHLNRDDERLDAMPIAPLMRQRFHAHADLVPHRIRAVAPVVRRAIAPAATGVAQCRHAKGIAQIGFHLHCLGTWNAVVGLHGFDAGRVVLAAAAVFQSRRLPAHRLQEILAFDIRSRQAIARPCASHAASACAVVCCAITLAANSNAASPSSKRSLRSGNRPIVSGRSFAGSHRNANRCRAIALPSSAR